MAWSVADVREVAERRREAAVEPPGSRAVPREVVDRRAAGR